MAFINCKIMILGALFSSLTAFGASKLSVELQASDAGSRKRVIVQFNSSGIDSHQRVLARHGLRLYSYLPLVNGSAVEISGSQLRDLADEPSVVSIVPDHTVRAADFAGGLDYGWMTALDVANTSTPYAYKGTGIGVAIIDSGVNAVDDLRTNYGPSRVVYQQSFVPGDPTTGDAYGHGTHVAGILAGNGSDSTGGRFFYTIRGIAPSVHIVSLRVLDQNGAGSDSAVIAAIQQTIQLKEFYNIRVVNLSIGRQHLGFLPGRPALSSGPKGLGSGPRRRRGGGKRWARQFAKYRWIRHCHVARKQPFCHHGGRHEHYRYALPHG